MDTLPKERGGGGWGGVASASSVLGEDSLFCHYENAQFDLSIAC